MRFLRHLALVVAVLALLAPAAHVLEMVNKLALDGPIWLAVQQQLYRSWGPLIGAPTEIAGLMLNAALAVSRVEPRRARWLSAGAYLAMIIVFFVCNAPVNAATNGWTAATLPADWQAYRWRWEIGHALSALLAVAALVANFRALRGRQGEADSAHARPLRDDVPSSDRLRSGGRRGP